MSTKQKTFRADNAAKNGSAASGLPALAERNEEDFQVALTQVRAVRELQHRYAAAIIGAGLFSNGELWTGIMAALAERDAAQSATALNDLFERLERATPGATWIAAPTPDDSRHTESAEDVLVTHATAWGDAGFLLGLAVGMQLGPHAFDGGAK
jgi:hypothetical protein